MAVSSLSGFMHRCASVSDALALWRASLAFFHGRGFRMITYRPEGETRVGEHVAAADGYPEGWADHCLDADGRMADPMPSVAARQAMPFWWSDVGLYKTLTAREQRYIEAARIHGLGDGLAMQVYGPEGCTAYVALGYGAGRGDVSQGEVMELFCAAQAAHVRFCALHPPKSRPAARLSRRETEVLRWIARGKSNSVIADILGISRHTVDTIMRRMFDKLEVNDRTTAAIRGLGAGLLRLRGSEVM